MYSTSSCTFIIRCIQRMKYVYGTHFVSRSTRDGIYFYFEKLAFHLSSTSLAFFRFLFLWAVQTGHLEAIGWRFVYADESNCYTTSPVYTPLNNKWNHFHLSWVLADFSFAYNISRSWVRWVFKFLCQFASHAIKMARVALLCVSADLMT